MYVYKAKVIHRNSPRFSPNLVHTNTDSIRANYVTKDLRTCIILQFLARHPRHIAICQVRNREISGD